MLPAWFKEAKKMMEKEKETHKNLTATFEDKDLIGKWEKESIELVKGPDGKWGSPLMDPELSSGGFHKVVKAERKKESPTALVPGRRPGATRWISKGIELEHNASNAQRLALRNRVDKFLTQRNYYMVDIGDSDLDKPCLQVFYQEGYKGEGIDFGMPSLYSPEAIEAAGLLSMADLEKELRRGMCNESLASVKQLLRARAKGFQHKRNHVRGREKTTRVEAGFQTQMKQVRKAAWQYSNSYEALKQLGLSEPDKRDYEDLDEKTDLATLKLHYEAYAHRKKGEKKPIIPWIWHTRAAPNTDEGDAEGLKTEWLRSRERCKHWEEQLVLTKREMVMTIRSFERYQELWTWKSQCPDVTEGMHAYARGQSKFYSKLANQMLISCQNELYDDTVELKWCKEWLGKNVIDNNGIVSLVTKI